MMGIAEVVNMAVPYLIMAAPYLKQLGSSAGEEATKQIAKAAASKLGDGSWHVAQSVWQKLRGTKPETLAAVDSALTNPQEPGAQETLRLQLKEALSDDASLLREIAEILAQAKSTEIEGSRNVTFGDQASNNIVLTGDGIVVGNSNVNLVSKKDD
jgi:hypothetical protein